MPAKIALTHLALHVRDLTANVAFYQRFCGLHCIHRRGEPGGPQVAWLAEPGRDKEFILVFISGGPQRSTQGSDFSNLGFALETRATVNELAAGAQAEGCLVWPARDEPYPVGYYCGLKDPD